MVYDTKRIYGIDPRYGCDGKERPEEPEYSELCADCQKKYDDDEDIPEECDYCSEENFSHYREIT